MSERAYRKDGASGHTYYLDGERIAAQQQDRSAE
jgi:hypothetical protein